MAYNELRYLSYLPFSLNVLIVLKEIVKARKLKIWKKDICPTTWKIDKCNNFLPNGEKLTKEEHATITRFIQTTVNIHLRQWLTYPHLDNYARLIQSKERAFDLLISLLEEHFVHKVRKDSFYNGLLAKQ